MSANAKIAPHDFFTRPLQPRSDASKYQDREAELGRLSEIIEIDASGRRISKFFGDPELTWAAFKIPAKHVVAWNR